MAIPTPLTTVWTPAPACFSDLYVDPSTAGVLGSRTGCNPPGYNQALTNFYYSPGIYCPASYTVAYSSVETIGTATETRAICCPNVDSNPELSGGIFSRQTSSDKPWYSSYGCTLQFGTLVDRGPITYTWTSPRTSTTTFRESSQFGINAYSVQIRWQASDLTTSTPSRTSTSTGTTGPAATSQTSSSTTPSPNRGTGLSTTAKIAIGIVIPIFVLAAIAAAVILLLRRRKRRNQPAANMSGTRYEPVDKPPQEISGREIKGYEMEHGTPRAELEANYRR